MYFLIKIVAILYIFMQTQAELLICDNNECNEAAVVSTDSLFSQLKTIIEGNENTTKYLYNLNERFETKINFITTEIEQIKHTLQEQAHKVSPSATEDNTIDSDTSTSTSKNHNEYSIYDQLWIVIQRRQDGSVDFNRNWTEYKNGFGNDIGEFHVGLIRVHNLTNDRPHELLIILEDFAGNMKYAHYDLFLIGNEAERYQLKELGLYSGNAGNHLRLHKKMFFSTKDRDNDMADEGSCAEWFKGAWWYYHCLTSNLNGPYTKTRHLLGNERGVGVTWGSFEEIQYSYKSTQMMIRSK